MKRKFILLPITLPTLAPAISLVGCGNPDKPEPPTPPVTDFEYEYFANGEHKIYVPKYDPVEEGSTTPDLASGESLYLETISKNNEILFDDLFYEGFLRILAPISGLIHGCLKGGQLSVDNVNKRFSFNYINEYTFEDSNSIYTDQVTYVVEKLPFEFYYASFEESNDWWFNSFADSDGDLILNKIGSDTNWNIQYTFSSNNPSRPHKNIMFSWTNYKKDEDSLIHELYIFLYDLTGVKSHYFSNLSISED